MALVHRGNLFPEYFVWFRMYVLPLNLEARYGGPPGTSGPSGLAVVVAAGAEEPAGGARGAEVTAGAGAGDAGTDDPVGVGAVDAGGLLAPEHATIARMKSPNNRFVDRLCHRNATESMVFPPHQIESKSTGKQCPLTKNASQYVCQNPIRIPKFLFGRLSALASSRGSLDTWRDRT